MQSARSELILTWLHQDTKPVIWTTLSKPTKEEIETALKMAAKMRDKNIDTFFRIKHLEEVLRSADRYINRGMSEQERAYLIRSIEKAKSAESHTSGERRSNFGLE